MTLNLVPFYLDHIDWSLTDMLLTHLLILSKSRRTMNDDSSAHYIKNPILVTFCELPMIFCVDAFYLQTQNIIKFLRSK